MGHLTGCPRCAAPPRRGEESWLCAEHGAVNPLLRPVDATYESFTEHLTAAGDFPTLLPWPMSPGWAVSDFGVVTTGRAAVATVTCCSGSSPLDGPVDVFVVAEEPGVGLGARCAGMSGPDPGPELGEGRPMVWVKVDSKSVPLWAMSTSVADEHFDRSVFVGEAGGRWLWIILRPASAMLLLNDDWILRDVSDVGPPLVELLFGGPRPVW